MLAMLHCLHGQGRLEGDDLTRLFGAQSPWHERNVEAPTTSCDSDLTEIALNLSKCTSNKLIPACEGMVVFSSMVGLTGRIKYSLCFLCLLCLFWLSCLL